MRSHWRRKSYIYWKSTSLFVITNVISGCRGMKFLYVLNDKYIWNAAIRTVSSWPMQASCTIVLKCLISAYCAVKYGVRRSSAENLAPLGKILTLVLEIKIMIFVSVSNALNEINVAKVLYSNMWSWLYGTRAGSYHRNYPGFIFLKSVLRSIVFVLAFQKIILRFKIDHILSESIRKLADQSR